MPLAAARAQAGGQAGQVAFQQRAVNELRAAAEGAYCQEGGEPPDRPDAVRGISRAYARRQPPPAPALGPGAEPGLADRREVHGGAVPPGLDADVTQPPLAARAFHPPSAAGGQVAEPAAGDPVE